MVTSAAEFGVANGQGWLQIGELGLAFALCALIGLEREARQKSAGLRTHTIVGVASALIMLVSKYGFIDVLTGPHISFDPSRVAAQIVSGIGFIGGGLIFVRKDAVQGLTTAAVVWLAAAVGMACGGGLPILAVAVTGAHFLIVFGLRPLTRRLPFSMANRAPLRLVYEAGSGVLRTTLEMCTRYGFTVAEMKTLRGPDADGALATEAGRDLRRDRAALGGADVAAEQVSVVLMLDGSASLVALAADLEELRGVVEVDLGARDDSAE